MLPFKSCIKANKKSAFNNRCNITSYSEVLLLKNGFNLSVHALLNLLLLIYRFDSLRNCFKSFRYLQLFRVKRTSKPCTFQISKVFFISVSILLDISAHRAWSTREYSTCTDGRKVVNSLRACMYGENHRAYDGK